MFITMHEQGLIEQGGNLMNTVQNAKENAKEKAQKYANLAISTNSRRKQAGYLERAEKYQKKGESYDKVARRWGDFHMIDNQDTNDFLNRIAAKYENASSGASVTHPFNKPMYFRDASEFYDEIRTNFEPLINDSFTELNRGNRVNIDSPTNLVMVTGLHYRVVSGLHKKMATHWAFTSLRIVPSWSLTPIMVNSVVPPVMMSSNTFHDGFHYIPEMRHLSKCST